MMLLCGIPNKIFPLYEIEIIVKWASHRDKIIAKNATISMWLMSYKIENTRKLQEVSAPIALIDLLKNHPDDFELVV